MNDTIGYGVFVTAEGGLPESTALPLYAKRITDEQAQCIIRSARCSQVKPGLRPRAVESGRTANSSADARYLLDISGSDGTGPIVWVNMDPALARTPRQERLTIARSCLQHRNRNN